MVGWREGPAPLPALGAGLGPGVRYSPPHPGRQCSGSAQALLRRTHETTGAQWADAHTGCGSHALKAKRGAAVTGLELTGGHSGLYPHIWNPITSSPKEWYSSSLQTLQSSDGCHCNSNVTRGLWGPEGTINSTQCTQPGVWAPDTRPPFPVVSCYLLVTVLELGVVCEVPAQPESTPVACLAKVREEAVASAALSWASIPSTCKPHASHQQRTGPPQVLSRSSSNRQE